MKDESMLLLQITETVYQKGYHDLRAHSGNNITAQFFQICLAIQID